jgi:hypothetical protein
MHHDPNYMKKVPFCEAKQDLCMVVSTFFQKYYSKNQPKIQRCPDELSGLLIRCPTFENMLFEARLFSRATSDHFIIRPGSYLSDRFYPTYPAWISWQIGAGHGEDYGKLGIDPGRWATLEPWLDRWLPRSEQQ